MDPKTILTSILVIITGVYAYLTYRMAKTSAQSVNVMEKQTEAMSRPYIAVGLFKMADSTFVYLKIENTGNTEAKNLRLRIDASPEVCSILKERVKDGKDITSAYAFNNTIKSFAPGTRLLYLVGLGASLTIHGSNDAALSPIFKVSTEYSFGLTVVSETTTIDINLYRHTVLEINRLTR